MTINPDNGSGPLFPLLSNNGCTTWIAVWVRSNTIDLSSASIDAGLHDALVLCPFCVVLHHANRVHDLSVNQHPPGFFIPSGTAFTGGGSNENHGAPMIRLSKGRVGPSVYSHLPPETLA